MQATIPHDAFRQGYLAVSAAVLQREDFTLLGAHDRDRLAGKRRRERPSSLDLMRPSDWIPIVGMRTDFPQIDPRPGCIRFRSLHARLPNIQQAQSNSPQLERDETRLTSSSRSGILIEHDRSFRKTGIRFSGSCPAC
jgi:hypothetical protein